MLINMLIFFFIGCFSLMLLTLIAYKTGLVHKTRDSAGHLKKKQSISGFIIMIIIFFLMTSFFNLFQILSFNNKSNYLEIVLWSSILILLLILFDSLFIDLLLIGKIRPSFLHIPDETTIDTMRIHVKRTFTIGWIFVIPIVLISSLITYFILK